MEGRPLFDLADYSIDPGSRYRLRDDARPVSPGPLPPHVVVTELPPNTGKVQFRDEAHASSEFLLATREFREVFDPA